MPFFVPHLVVSCIASQATKPIWLMTFAIQVAPWDANDLEHYLVENVIQP